MTSSKLSPTWQARAFHLARKAPDVPNASPEPHSTATEDARDRVAHPEVVGTIRSILRAARTPQQDIDDAVTDVQVRVLSHLGSASSDPTTVEATKAVAIRCARSHIVDRYRRAKRRRRAGHMGVVIENPDDHAHVARRLSERHALDHEKALRLLIQLLEDSDDRELDWSIVEGLADDVDQAEIAAEQGLPHRDVRDRLAKIRRRYARMVAATLGAGALAVMFVLARNPGAPSAYPLASDTTPAEATPLQLAQDLRELAKPYCRRGDWAPCLARLDAARDYDPQGDKAPEIQAVRDAAARETDDLMLPFRAKAP